jgi:predicted unusual protein kinase regulating ubiquinone biosynthesis (AarF/ABC1/UbiB family)
VVASAAAGAAAGAVVAGTRIARDPAQRARVTRSARVWRLTTRNGIRWAAMKARGVTTHRGRGDELNQQFVIRTAEDVARELGQMKGALMKAAQLISFILEALPDDAQQALATLQADAPPMSPALAAQVVTDELGAPPEKVFLDWSLEPIAAASVGQVHRAVTRDGRVVAVKVQYPGVGDAIGADLDNAQALYAMISAFALKGLDTKGLVNELRARMIEELDYVLEARNQQEFAQFYADHPFISVPSVLPELSTRRVLTSEWVDGLTWAQFVARADETARRRAGEVIWRFAQGSVHRLGAFNGDPHPGNYRFSADGDVTFLDFGLVKRWTAGEWERLAPCLDAILDHDPVRLIAAMEQVEFLEPGLGLDPDAVFDYVATPYRPYLSDRFTFTREFMKDTVERIADLKGPEAKVIEQLNLPPSFVILDRVVWGVSALLGKLGVSGPWRAMLLEYRRDDPPATELGRLDQQWWMARQR